MRFAASVILCIASVLLTSCSKSPSAPSDETPTQILEGQTVNAIDGAPAAGLSVQIGSAPAVTTDSSGYFRADVGKVGRHTTTITGNAVVERYTTVNAPLEERARLSLIPASFDLTAFDEMFRTTNDRLQRWTTRPSLVVLATVMSYRGGSNGEYSATGEQVPAADVSQMAADLTEGLALLTGGTYTAFEAIDIERPASGDRVSVARSGKIVVGRYKSVTSTAGTIGYGQWAEEADGSVVAGVMFLDHEFDRDDPRRRLLRMHELGHALGYLHVASRESIMNAAIGPEPTEFDRAAAVIAFQRPPGNRTPDIDPSAEPRSVSGGKGVRWVTPVS